MRNPGILLRSVLALVVPITELFSYLFHQYVYFPNPV
jgi:hypothetical protein